MYVMIKVIVFMLLRPDQPKYWQIFSKMIVYSVCMNLQVHFVRVASSLVWTIIKSILTEIGPENQTKVKIINCRWTHCFGELLVYVLKQNCCQYHDHVTFTIFKPTYTDSH